MYREGSINIRTPCIEEEDAGSYRESFRHQHHQSSGRRHHHQPRHQNQQRLHPSSASQPFSSRVDFYDNTASSQPQVFESIALR
jgi:hypothetical protein